MSIKLKNIKKFVLWCSVFLLICINLVFAIDNRLKYGSLGASSTQNLQIILATGNGGNVAVEENSHFKRYVISCNKEIEQVQWDDKKAYIDIHLNKNDVSSLNAQADEKLETKDIYYSNTKDGLILSIKKYKASNNSVSIDKNNRKKINILISKEDNPYSHIVVLDAGHGGIDKGANYGSLYEKDINLKIANYAAEDLEFKGFKVIQTRDDDKFLSLKEIGEIANSASAEIFVSVHVNENKENKYKGVTSYYYDPSEFQKEERIKLAKTIQKELVKSDKWDDRGILRQNFAVLRYSKIPCVLLECGFLSNAEDRGKLTKDSVLKNFAVNITNGVINYFGVE